jgi:hypothetical protein
MCFSNIRKLGPIFREPKPEEFEKIVAAHFGHETEQGTDSEKAASMIRRAPARHQNNGTFSG